MKPNRLVILVAAMLALAAGRFLLPPQTSSLAIVEPVTKHAAASATSPTPSAPTSAPVAGDDVPGNAFPIRALAQPAASPMPAVPGQPAALNTVAATPPEPPPTPSLPAPPPAPPLQVIGTYEDGGPPAIFIASPSGTLIARLGTVLMAEYRVTAITADQVTMVQEATNRTFQLPVPGNTSR